MQANNIWEQLNVKNDGYPRILSNILAADTSTSEGISVQALKVHPASELRVTELDPDSGRYKEMQEKAKKPLYIECTDNIRNCHPHLVIAFFRLHEQIILVAKTYYICPKTSQSVNLSPVETPL